MFYQLHGNTNTCLEKKQDCLCASLSSPSHVGGKIVLNVEKKKMSRCIELLYKRMLGKVNSYKLQHEILIILISYRRAM